MPRNTHRSENSTMISMCTFKLILPGCKSLKQKRSLLQPILTRLHKEFNISVSEIGLQDVWQSAWVGCVIISNDADHNTHVLNDLISYVEVHFPEVQISEHHIENH